MCRRSISARAKSSIPQALPRPAGGSLHSETDFAGSGSGG